MTILSAQAIRRRCTFGGHAIGETATEGDMISPFDERSVHEPTGMSYGLSSCGYDVRIDQELRWPDGFIDDGIALYQGAMLRLPPRSVVLASTVERFVLPRDVCMVVRDKSSWARQGIFVQNTVAEPGWRGHLTLEVSNDSYRNVVLPAGAPIAQCMFERLDEASEQPYPARGKYQDQERGPQPHRREG